VGPGDLFLGSGSAGIIKLTTHLHLELKLRIMGAVPPPLLMTSWHILGQLSLMTIKEFMFPVWLPQYNLPSIKPHTMMMMMMMMMMIVVVVVVVMMKAARRHITYRARLSEFSKKMGKRIMHGQYLKSIDS
jgi:uncharacterized membrane protein